MSLTAVFVAGLVVGGAAGYGARRHPALRAVGPAHVPQHVRRAPTHPAVPRPVLYDWARDGAA